MENLVIDNEDIESINNIKTFNYFKLLLIFVIYIYFFSDRKNISFFYFNIITTIFLVNVIFSLISNKLLFFNWNANNTLYYVNYALLFKTIESFSFLFVIIFVLIKKYNNLTIKNLAMDFIIISLINLLELYKIYVLKTEIEKKNNTLIDNKDEKNKYLFILEKNIEEYQQEFTNKVSAISQDEMCVICQDNSSKSLCLTKCNHIFHSECLKKWLNNNDSCPLCRKPIILNKNIQVV